MKRIMILLVSLLLYSMPVYAQQEFLYKIDFDIETNKASVYALFDTHEEKCVKLIVLKPGSGFDNIDNEEYSFNENVHHIDQLYTSEGVIQTDFKLGDTCGLYKGRINSGEIHEFKFYVSNSSELKSALSKLNGDETAVKSFLETEAEKIGVYEYQKLSEEAKNNVVTSILKETFTIGNDDAQIISNAQTAKDFINTEISANLIADSAATAQVKKLIKVYGKELELKTEEAFALLEERDKNDILNTLITEEISTSDELSAVFNKNTSYKVIAKLPYGYVEDALKAFPSINYSYYNKLKNKNTALKGISGNVYNSEEALKSAFEKLCEEAYKEENKVNLSTGGGGGGGGTGQKAVGYTPVQEAVNDNNPTVGFVDIKDVVWAKDAIEALHKDGIISGRSNGIFAPNDFVTRAEFVKMLVLTTNVFSDNARCEFVDAKAHEWFYLYVASAYENRLIEGDDNNRFNPNVNISREDIATMLYRAVTTKGHELAKVSEYSEFNDSDVISDYAQEAIKELKTAGIINGMEDNTFRPKSNATRAQAAVMLWAYLNAIR